MAGFFQNTPGQIETDAYTADALASKNAAEAAEAEAEAAEAAAEAAQAAAETAESNAETAEANAETAETNAETAETNAAGSATSATNSASTATTKASEAAASASTASTASTSATNSSNTATTKAAEASTSASNAASSETAAGNSAATSATQAQNSSASAASSLASKTASEAAKVSAETAETNAETAETNAAGSATAAAGSATSATNSSSTASSQASASATQASSSASSATASSNSAASAATAQNAAQAARDAALAALDSFDDRYLGSKSSAPTVDNDGNALVSGALYFDSTATAMKVWDGSNWLSAYASLSGALIANNNLSDLNNAATARSNLGIGNISNAGINVTGAITASGEITANGGISLVDNKKLTFGTGDDLEVYHDGFNSYIDDVGTGNILIRGANVLLTTGAGTKYLEGGSNVLRLYHTGNQRMQTSAFGISVTGSVTATGTSIFDALDISGDIDVDGTTNLDIVDIDGALTQDGGVVFNEASADVDFRVESNGNANMLFVDGGNNRVGIGVVPVQGALTIKAGGNTYATSNLVLEDTDSTSRSYITHVNGDLAISNSTSRDDLIINSAGAATFSSTGTFAGGNTNFTNDADVVTLNGSLHTRLLIDTSSTGGHQAAIVLESNGSQSIIGNTGSNTSFAVATGNLTLDVAGDIILDADGGDITFNDGGTTIGQIRNQSSDLVFQSSVSDKDIKFVGNDGGSDVTALTLDMSAAGAATFNAGVTTGGEVSIAPSSGTAKVRLTSQGAGSEVFTINGQIPGVANGGFAIRNETDSRNDFTIDAAGAATFSSSVSLGGTLGVTGNITVSGTVDGRDIASDGTKLNTIETGATADQTNAEIRTAVEAATNSNVFTDADHTKLNAIAASANNYSFPYTVSASAGSNTIVQRTSAGYIVANYINTTANDVTSGVTKVMVETNNDNYIRHGSAAAIRTFLNVENGATADQTSVSGSSGSCTGNAATATALTAGAKTISGNLTVGSGTASYINMVDTDHGNRSIHCNSDRIGFLTSSNAWSAYSVDTGRWHCDLGLYVYGNINTSANVGVVGFVESGIFSGSGASNGFKINSGQSVSSRTITSNAAHATFYNPNGAVGTIFTAGSATHYATSSDPRLKSEFTPITGASEMILEARDQGAIGEFHFLADPDQTVWGYNAHKVADLQVGFGGCEGEGPRDLKLGTVYEEAVMGERPLMVTKLDAEGSPTGEMIESGEMEEYEVSPEKTVSPAGVDQSKRVPLLEAAIGELLDRIAVIEASNEALLDRITALENA